MIFFGEKSRVDKEKMKRNTAGRARQDGKRGMKGRKLESEKGGCPETRGRRNQRSGAGEMLDSLSGLETFTAQDEKDGSSCGGAGFWSCFSAPPTICVYRTGFLLPYYFPMKRKDDEKSEI